MQARSALSFPHRRDVNRGSSQRQRSDNSSRRRQWFPEQPAAIDEPLRDIVAHRFMDMNQEHDRIRMQLLASHAPHHD